MEESRWPWKVKQKWTKKKAFKVEGPVKQRSIRLQRNHFAIDCCGWQKCVHQEKWLQMERKSNTYLERREDENSRKVIELDSLKLSGQAAEQGLRQEKMRIRWWWCGRSTKCAGDDKWSNESRSSPDTGQDARRGKRRQSGKMTTSLRRGQEQKSEWPGWRTVTSEHGNNERRLSAPCSADGDHRLCMTSADWSTTANRYDQSRTFLLFASIRNDRRPKCGANGCNGFKCGFCDLRCLATKHTNTHFYQFATDFFFLFLLLSHRIYNS